MQRHLSCLFLYFGWGLFLFCMVMIFGGSAAFSDEKSFKAMKFYTPQYASSPIFAGFDLVVPHAISEQSWAKWGIVDVTSSPFYADPTGKTDSTEALQEAINFARDHQLVVYLPAGEYLISDTLECMQDYKRLKDGSYFVARQHPCVLIGNQTGDRPKIILGPNSKGFSDPDRRKYVVRFYARISHNLTSEELRPSIHQNQVFSGIDIHIREGNSGAVGLRFRGAEGCFVNNVLIDATHGYSGFEGGIGSGGSVAGLAVIGGQIGLDLIETQPTPTFSDITLKNQTKTAIRYGGRQSLVVVGGRIFSSAAGPIIQGGEGWPGPHRGQMSLVDSVIVCSNERAVALATQRSLYLRNVYVKGAHISVSGGDKAEVPGDHGWVHIREYAYGIPPKTWKGVKFLAPIYLNGVRSECPLIDYKIGEKPSDKIISKHVFDTHKGLGFWASKVVNVKEAPYNAVGDGKEDDTEAIQRAINENSAVFIPKGYYLVSKTIELKPDTKLLGVARNFSIIIANSSSSFFAQGVPKPLLRTPNTPDSSVIIDSLQLFIPMRKSVAYALQWQSGGASALKNVSVRFQGLSGDKVKNLKVKMDYPLVVASGHAGGRWYNFDPGINKFGHGKNYSHLQIQKCSGPFYMYQCSPQHSKSNTNMNILDSKNIFIYGMKSESDNAKVIKIARSNNINVIGYGGVARADEGGCLFEIVDSCNVNLINIVDTPIYIKNKTNSREWSMINESCGDAKITTKYFDRPVLYRTNNCKSCCVGKM